jgi:diguanylate cyclase (GGDEF)-like protein
MPVRGASDEGDESTLERRRRSGRPQRELVAWIGLRFERDCVAADAEALSCFPPAHDVLRDDNWWKGFLGLAAAFASHARTLARTVFDPITGLPGRAEFQAELEVALAHAEETRTPSMLVLLGPDDFGWVNERLDRRAGDRVLREIASAIRSGLRSQDHVARYGGAIFSAILLDTPIESARVVAENVIRRLSEQRYHRGILGLEFSAGLAGVAPGERMEAQELLRRADQALSAAKRGSAGNVRVWEKGSDVENAQSLDRLQGIFTGDKSKDYRNMRLLLDSVAVVASSTDPGDLARSFTGRLFEALQARRVAVFERVEPQGYELLGGLERGPEGTQPFRDDARDRALLDRACTAGNFVLEAAAAGQWSRCALPLSLQGRCLGAIVLEASSPSLSLEGSDRKFLDALASEMAVALDRVRLIERERRREREEKERLEAEVTDLRRVVHGSRLAYRSRAMETLLGITRKVAHTDTTVLITGESGTGKEMLAQTLHELSPRHERPLVVVDCTAVSPTLIESELFGHERGAFTGAHARRAGRLAQADGATIFLDEIGDLPLNLQSKLLRFVQEKQFTPVGGVVPQRVDARIIAATNVDLRARVAEGRFREDLFHRLNVVRLHVPPLRERGEDILHLARVFLKQFAALYRRPAHHFTPEAEKALQAYSWPGNVRELQNSVLTSVLFCDAPAVDRDDLQGFPSAARAETAAAGGAVRGSASLRSEAAATRAAAAPLLLRQALAEVVATALASAGKTRAAVPPLGRWLTEDIIVAAERLSDGVSRRAADLLGIPETTYRRQLRNATRSRSAGLSLRPPTWSTVAGALEDFIRDGRGESDVCDRAAACLLSVVEAAVAGDTPTVAAFLGVTEPTVLRRQARRQRRSEQAGAPE